jgi:hypothetical protein
MHSLLKESGAGWSSVQTPMVIFRQFVTASEGNPICVTSANFSRLFRLCKELGFTDLRSNLSLFSPLQETEAEVQQRDRDIVVFQTNLTGREANIGRLESEISQMRPAPQRSFRRKSRGCRAMFQR